MVLNTPWYIESSPVVLKKWSPLFDVSHEKVDKLPLCVHLPGLPVELWTKEGFLRLGNTIWSFLDVDMSFLTTSKISMAKFLFISMLGRGLQRKWSFPRVVNPSCKN